MCSRWLLLVCFLVEAFVCAYAAVEVNRMKVYYVFAENVTNSPALAFIPAVRSRLECVTRCQENATCLYAFHASRAQTQAKCYHFHKDIVLTPGTVPLKPHEMTSSDNVWTFVPMKPYQWTSTVVCETEECDDN